MYAISVQASSRRGTEAVNGGGDEAGQKSVS